MTERIMKLIRNGGATEPERTELTADIRRTFRRGAVRDRRSGFRFRNIASNLGGAAALLTRGQ
jgi:hypothetical protein